MNINLSCGVSCQNATPSEYWTSKNDVLQVTKAYSSLGVRLTTCHSTLLVTKVSSSTIELINHMGILMPTTMSHCDAYPHQAWTIDICQKVTKTSSVLALYYKGTRTHSLELKI